MQVFKKAGKCLLCKRGASVVLQLSKDQWDFLIMLFPSDYLEPSCPLLDVLLCSFVCFQVCIKKESNWLMWKLCIFLIKMKEVSWIIVLCNCLPKFGSEGILKKKTIKEQQTVFHKNSSFDIQQHNVMNILTQPLLFQLDNKSIFLLDNSCNVFNNLKTLKNPDDPFKIHFLL